ncbi:MAG: protein GlxC [Pseudomonadota bacterium]
MPELNMEEISLREVNQTLQDAVSGSNETFDVLNPHGSHAVAVGLVSPIDVTIHGSTGYYTAGMNQEATIRIAGSAGPGVAQNMMSGKVIVDGDASQYAGATAQGGLLVVKGNATSRCAIQNKGGDIVVFGNIGHMSAYMAQSGNLVVLGDAGDGLGDGIFECQLFVRGEVKSLGADCIEKEMRPEHVELLSKLLADSGADAKPEEFRRYGSERTLYHFHVDNAVAE